MFLSVLYFPGQARLPSTSSGRALLYLCAGALLLSAAPAVAQTSGISQAAQAPQTSQQPVGPIVLPTVIVTAQKEPADAQRLPVSLTAIAGRTLLDAGITFVSDAAIYAPNTFFSELTARKISNANFRGIGSSPANPGITTYYRRRSTAQHQHVEPRPRRRRSD